MRNGFTSRKDGAQKRREEAVATAALSTASGVGMVGGVDGRNTARVTPRSA